MTKAMKIKEARLKRGMTQEELAAKTGLTVRSIQRIENNSVTARADNIRKIAMALDIPFEDLNGDMEAQPLPTNKKWLIALHATSLIPCILPTIVVWLYLGKSDENIKSQVTEIINFQINALLAFLVLGLSAFLLVTVPILMMLSLGFYFTVVVNTIRVGLGMSHKYPVVYPFLR